MKIRDMFIILSIFLLASCSSTKEMVKVENPMMNYESLLTLSEVLDKAEREDKVIFLDLYTDWCLPCKVMDEEVFNDRATADFMNDNFINYKVNAEIGEGPDLAVLYNVKGYPTHLFLDGRGNVIERNLGALGIVGFNVLAERVLAAHKDQ